MLRHVIVTIGTVLLMTASGSYTFTTTNASGCDSTATLNLTINNATSSTTDVTACDSYDWNGTTYTASGSYTFTTTNASGCDSTATLNLTINNMLILILLHQVYLYALVIHQLLALQLVLTLMSGIL